MDIMLVGGPFDGEHLAVLGRPPQLLEFLGQGGVIHVYEREQNQGGAAAASDGETRYQFVATRSANFLTKHVLRSKDEPCD